MSCFWDAILKKVHYFKEHNIKNSIELLQFLKKNNCITCHVLWQNKKLQNTLLRQNFIDVEQYNESTKDGHWTSSCDIFLLLVCEIACIDIEFNMLNTKILFKNILNQDNKSVTFTSSSSHFS